MAWLINLLLDRGNDLSTYFLPNAYFVKRSILELHQIPLWNPLQLGGIPYLADPQNYLFYLPNYLLLLLPVELAFLILIFSHLLWGGLGVYKLVKHSFRLNSLFSVSCSLFFVFSPVQIAHLEAGHYTMLVAFSWLPWFFLVAFKFLNKPSLKYCLLLSVLCFLLYINYINIAYYSLLFLASYSIWYYLTHRSHFPVKKYLILNTVYLILFLILISPNLIPQLKFVPQTTRHLITFTDVAQPIWSFKLFAQNLFFPFFLNSDQLSTERVLYPGLFVMLLAIYGWIKHKSPQKYFLAGWVAFSLLFALGSRIPFFILFYRFFPLMKFMRVPTRIWVMPIIFLIIYAAYGLKVISNRNKRSTIVVALLYLVALADIILIDYKFFSRPIPKEDLPPSFYEILTQDNNSFRVYCTTGCWSLQKIGELGIPTIGGNNPIQRQEIVTKLAQAAGYKYDKYIPVLPPYEVFNQKPQPNAKLMRELDVKYIASPYLLTNPALQLIHEDRDYYLYLNSGLRN